MVETQYPKNSLADKLDEESNAAQFPQRLTDLAASAHLMESQLALKIKQLEDEKKNSDFWYDKFISTSQHYNKFVKGMNSILQEGE